MPQFRYVAFEPDNKRATGMVEAENAEAALDTLSARYRAISELRPVKTRFRLSRGNTQEELLQLTQEMSALLGSGISLKQALDIVVSDFRATRLYPVAVEVNAAVTSGTPFSVAIRRYPRVFSRFYVNMVEAGEASGNLPEMLDRLAACVARADNLVRKLKATVTYPVIVLSFSLAIVTLLLVFGVPQIAGLYRDMGSRLPAPTRTLLTLSSWLSDSWGLVGILGLGAFLGLRHWARTGPGALRLDAWKLNAPGFGFYRQLLLARFSRTLATLYASGVPVLHALELSGGSLNNREAERLVEMAGRGVAQGATLTSLLRGLPFFTEMALGLINAGETTGTLAPMLGRVADYYETRFEVSLEVINRAVEPILMIGVGLMVGLLVLVLGLPFMNLAAVA